MIQFFKYIFVGAINFIISTILFFLFIKVFKINYLISFTVIWLFGIVLTYLINFIWVFKPDEKLEFKKRFPKYFTVYLISYIANILMLKCLVSEYNFDPFYIQFAILPIVICINFFGFKYWGLK